MSKPQRIEQSFASLSRNALYAPLNTYIPNQDAQEATADSKNGNAIVNNNNRNNKKKNNEFGVGKNLQEKTLYKFLHNISTEYHSSTSPLGHLGGTNGGCPMRLQHVETKIAQRALTLIGGGCGNAFFAKSTSSIEPTGISGEGGGDNDTKSHFPSLLTSQKRKKMKRFNYVHGSLSNKKRKKAIMRQQEKVSGIESNDNVNSNVTTSNKNDDSKVEGGGVDTSGIIIDCTKEILLGLNEVWNNYMNALLHQSFGKYKESSPLSSLQKEKIATLVSTAEMIGAHVLLVGIDLGAGIPGSRRNSNTSKKLPMIGKAGIIVDVTKNTWRIAFPKQNTVMKKIDDVEDDVKWSVCIVPKKTYSVVTIIRLFSSSTTQKGEKETNEIKNLHIKITT